MALLSPRHHLSKNRAQPHFCFFTTISKINIKSSLPAIGPGRANVKLFNNSITNLSVAHFCFEIVFLQASLLGLLAKIMCSICSCQLNIWHTRHVLVPILNWFLTTDLDIEACFSQITDCPGLALLPGTVHSTKKTFSQLLFAPGHRSDWQSVKRSNKTLFLKHPFTSPQTFVILIWTLAAIYCRFGF